MTEEEKLKAFWDGELAKKKGDTIIYPRQLKEAEVVAKRIYPRNDIKPITDTSVYKLGKIGVQMLDPTGITSWGDVYEAGKELKENPSMSNWINFGLEAAGAVPVIGKLGKIASIAGKGRRYYKALGGLENVINKGVLFQQKLDKAKEVKKIAETPVKYKKVGRKNKVLETNYDLWRKPTKEGIGSHMDDINEYNKAKRELRNNKTFIYGQLGVRGIGNLDDTIDAVDAVR